MMTRSSIEALESRIAPASLALGTATMSSGSVTFDAADTLSATLNDAAGSGKLVVTGSVTINGATLSLDVSQLPGNHDNFTLIDNDDTDLVTGTFAGLPEGKVFKVEDTYFQISYVGNDGNDVVLTALVPDLKIATGGHSATFTDVDGDLVMVKTTKGTLTTDSFNLVPRGDLLDGAQLTELHLTPDFVGATVSVTAKRGFEGNGFVNIGYLNATGVSLKSLSLKGDVTRIDLGDSTSAALAAKTLTVQSIGQLGTSILDAGTPDVPSVFAARLGALVVKSDVRDTSLSSAKGFGNVTIGGSFIESQLESGADIGAVSIKHDLVGSAGSESVISAFGKAVSPTKGVDLAIKSLTVGGRVERANIAAGYDLAGQPLNADASIGAVKVGGDWIASNLTAGTFAGPDGYVGTGDDLTFDNAGHLTGYRNTTLISQIASITVGGQVFGTASDTTDTFGFVAESIKAAKIGGVKLPVTVIIHEDFLAVAPTGPGATGKSSDVYLVEVFA